MELLIRDKNTKSSVLLTTNGCLERVSVIVEGASTLVDDGPKEAVFYATEVASPLFGAAVLTADESHSVVASYVNKYIFPSGASTSVADGYNNDTMCATEVAVPGGVENKQGCACFMRLKSHPRSDYEQKT
jgi:hypothetical protein